MKGRIRLGAHTQVRPIQRFARVCPSKKAAIAILTLAATLSLHSHPAAAQAEGLSLKQALEKALGQNKELAAFEHRRAEQEGRIQQASLLPNPELALVFENFGGQGIREGFETAETTLSLGWALEPGLRGRRVGVARARSERTSLEERILQLDVAAETALRFLASLESQEHLEAAREAVALAERTVAAVERRVRAGRAPKAELTRARAELAIERLAWDDVTHERSVAYHWLAAQWGETAPAFPSVDGDLLRIPELPSFDDLAARIEENPGLARLASEQRVAEAQLRVDTARRWPTLTPSLGARNFQATGNWALVAGLKVPFPVFDRNQGRVVESRATVARARADAEAQRVRVHATLYEIYEEMQHDVHRAEVLRGEVIPRLEETVDEMRQGYEKGRYRYSELRTVQAEGESGHRNADEHGHESDHGSEARAPNGGRLFRSGEFELELGIFERGTPPEYRAWARNAGSAVEPRDFALEVKQTRLGGKVDHIAFEPRNDYRASATSILEPHSFEVSIEAVYRGQSHEWQFESFEGRTRIEPEMAKSLGVETELAGPAKLTDRVTVYGRVRVNPERVLEVRARFEGLVTGVHAQVGSSVRKGEKLLSIESNESLNAYSIVAPISGVVTQRDANPGEQTHGRILMTITDTSSVWVDLSIFPIDRDGVVVGSPVSIEPALGGEQVGGIVSLLETVADAHDQTVIARVVLEDAGAQLLPGTFVTAEVEVEEYEVPLAVKRSGLQTFRDFRVVYARVRDVYEVRMLDLGRTAGEWVEVLGGLEPGTSYVTSNSHLIKADIEKSGAAHSH
ncbi:MAG: TolC family protein [Deltaproteobacteria bacterium]|nr:TolC family protein [Deltaproteobacteria bacterium]